ncbi:uncharacterized protein BDCG_08024 [Blastomyces dermatitidis ER-3]|uniref:Myb-like domain-containing protein n=1 Tax=Ajellomyces dermatitidis (strain ER-3 / ATCC MYA-2586) TaxID=559297 RepID=A0ABP2ENN8_AJEDR|nr:uncharacterized protein BDCG_08024 [Blastomyces dermatitidis ER-3]EEQ84755.1 hypothetical protein BDCG_08024 [Blastomyces dermatitidis ER-3]
MALSRRRAHRDISIAHDQLPIPRRSATSNFSATQSAWCGKVVSQDLEPQANYGHPEQFFNPSGKFETLNSSYAISTNVRFTESKYDDRDSVRLQTQQRHRGPQNVEFRFDSLPGPNITTDTNTGWASLAGSGPVSEPAPAFSATVPRNGQRQSNSTVPTVPQPLIRSNLGCTPSGSIYPAMETPGGQHYIPRVQTQIHEFKNCNSSWEGDRKDENMSADGGSHQHGYIYPGWAEPMTRMPYMPISRTSDTNTESAYPTTIECLEQTGNRGYVPDFTAETTNGWWHGAQNFIQQPQRWSNGVNKDFSASLITQTSLPIAQSDWNELHTTPLGNQCSPESSFSSCFTPDTLHEPVNFDSLSFHDMNMAMEYFDQNPGRERLTEWQGHLTGDEPFEPNEIPAIKQPGRPRKMKRCEAQRTASIGTQRASEKDEFLIQCKRAGMPYKEIKEKGNFFEAESTLRGRFRTLTKRKEQRVRKPGWQEKDVRLLCEAVRKYANPIQDGVGEDIKDPKISWKQVGEYISKNGGSYHFGNATCKKKWSQIQQDIITLRPEHQFG